MNDGRGSESAADFQFRLCYLLLHKGLARRKMTRIFAVLLLTAALVTGPDFLAGFRFGTTPLAAHMFSVHAVVSDGEMKRDTGSPPRGTCCQVACAHMPGVPEQHDLADCPQPAARLMPRNDDGPHAAFICREPPVPRALTA